MKTIKLLSILFAVSLLAVSCDKNNTIDSNAPVAVKFSSGIKVATKAIDAAWENNDAIGIYMKKTNTALSDENILESAKNRVYTTVTANLGKFNADAPNTIYYPVNGDAVDFIAYYPQTDAITDYVCNLNIVNQSVQQNIDLMYSNNAVNKSKANANVPLTFDHMLAKLTFTLVAGEGITEADIKDATIAIKDIYTEGAFNLATKTLTTTGVTGSIAPLKAANSIFAEAIIIPQTTTGKVVEFTVVTVGTDVFKWTINKDFEAGKKYEYSVTINRTGASVTGTINDWESIDSENIIAN